MNGAGRQKLSESVPMGKATYLHTRFLETFEDEHRSSVGCVLFYIRMNWTRTTVSNWDTNRHTDEKVRSLPGDW